MSKLHKAAQQSLEALEYHVAPPSASTWRTTAAITALRAAMAQQQAGSWQDGVLEGHLRERERWLAQEQAEPKKGGNLPPPLQTHCPNCAGPETQNTELDRKAAFAKRGEALYHPCTYILILGLKKLNAYDVLAEWDKARAEVDALAPRQTEKVK